MSVIEKLDNDIRISAKTAYLSRESEPASNKFIFSYTIKIENCGLKSAQLLSRHWVITDANDDKEEVAGAGVVGAQPVIEPDAFYEYTSYAIIKTPVGNMHGTYTMLNEDDESFQAVIPVFRLAIPRILN